MYYYFMQTKALEKEIAKLKAGKGSETAVIVDDDSRVHHVEDNHHAESTQEQQDTMPTASPVVEVPESTTSTIEAESTETPASSASSTVNNSNENDTIPRSEETPEPESTVRPRSTPPTSKSETGGASLYDMAPRVKVRSPQRNSGTGNQ